MFSMKFDWPSTLTAFSPSVMVVVSIIPGIGIALVWVPAAILLASSGRPGAA